MKKLGILLPGRIGDIIICLPIAKYYHDQGYDIHWPVYDFLIDNFKDNIDYVSFYPLNTQNLNPIEDSEKIFIEKGCVMLDLSFTSPGTWHRKNTHQFVSQNSLSFDEFRYKLARVPFEEKWNLKFNRIKEREIALYNQLVQNPNYCVVQLEVSDGVCPHQIEYPKDYQLIEIKPFSKSVFDWMYVLENAKVLAMYDSCFANLIEQTNLKNKKIFFKRTGPLTTPILKNTWKII
jgi:hypothetical protein